MNRQRLGRGLEALIPKDDILGAAEGVVEISLDKIKPNPLQPRIDFDLEKLNALAETIRSYGVIQPVIVQKEDDDYVLVAGERRFRAAKIAGIKTIPALIKKYNNNQLMEITLVENLQREDLNPIEEAAAYKKLIEEFGLSQEELAGKLGRSRSAIANSVRLLSLCDEVKNFIVQGDLSVGQARPLLSLGDDHDQISFAQKIISNKLTARRVEDLIKNYKGNKKKGNRDGAEGDIQPADKGEKIKEFFIKDLEDNLRKIYGTKVIIKTGAIEGKVVLYYYGDEDLERLTSLLIEKE